MSRKCDTLKVLAEIETAIEKGYAEKGYVNYEMAMNAILEIKHGIQVAQDSSVNELKKDLGVYHNK